MRNDPIPRNVKGIYELNIKKITNQRIMIGVVDRYASLNERSSYKS